MTQPRRHARSLGLLLALLSPLGLNATASAAPDAGADGAGRTFGIHVVDNGDRVAKIVGALGGVRVQDLDAGSLARSVKHPDARRYLNRGDFILRVRVAGIDPEPARGAPTLDTAESFAAACDHVRSVVAALPDRKATIIFDVFTQAGYNLEDWKEMRYEVELDLGAPAT